MFVLLIPKQPCCGVEDDPLNKKCGSGTFHYQTYGFWSIECKIGDRLFNSHSDIDLLKPSQWTILKRLILTVWMTNFSRFATPILSDWKCQETSETNNADNWVIVIKTSCYRNGHKSILNCNCWHPICPFLQTASRGVWLCHFLGRSLLI